jgi:hypothetical protein
MRAMTRRARRLAAVSVLAAAAVVGYAGVRAWRGGSSVPGPRALEFRPSPDHDAVDAKGVPIVQRYVFEVYRIGASTPVEKIDLGKPSPTADGLLHVDLSSLPMRSLVPGTIYEATITAVGPYGSGASDRSNRFIFNGR